MISTAQLTVEVEVVLVVAITLVVFLVLCAIVAVMKSVVEILLLLLDVMLVIAVLFLLLGKILRFSTAVVSVKIAQSHKYDILQQSINFKRLYNNKLEFVHFWKIFLWQILEKAII